MCSWASDPTIVAWMKAHKLSTFGQLEQYFVQRVLPVVTAAGKTPMYWEEVFK